MSEAQRRAVFLDRDGVLNALVVRDGLWVSPRRLEDFRVLPEAAEAVGRLRRLGLLVFVVTNQPDVARGHLGAADLEAMHERLRSRIPLNDLAVCPHDDDDGCSCRKPLPGMLLRLAERWAVDPRRSWVVGDGWKDVEAGRRAGCRTILIVGPGPRPMGGQAGSAPDCGVGSLEEAVTVIESEVKA